MKKLNFGGFFPHKIRNSEVISNLSLIRTPSRRFKRARRGIKCPDRMKNVQMQPFQKIFEFWRQNGHLGKKSKIGPRYT